MILEELTLRNWRQYREEHRFFFGEGTNLVVGPNEAGKSTLFAGFDTLGAELMVDGVADDVRLRALFDELRRTPSLVPKREFRVLGNHVGW